jgi:C_GCAxxG_C_C family probable redox protein
LIPRIATGFCSGISRTGGMCGAVSGAIMGINLVAGRNSPAESLEVSYALAQQLIGRFERQYGSIREWLTLWANEVHYVSRIVWETLLVQLPAVE